MLLIGALIVAVRLVALTRGFGLKKLHRIATSPTALSQGRHKNFK